MFSSTEKTIGGGIRSAVLASAFVFALSAPALAAGGDDSSSNSNANQCRAGKVWDEQKEKCVPKSSSLDQDSLFKAGRSLAYAGDYDGAIELLAAAPDRRDARVLNMLGYANRKLGNRDLAMAYYKHSMAADPQYALVREYYAKALLQEGDVHGARNQLAVIEKLCGKDCEIYAELRSAIDNHITGAPEDQRKTYQR